MKANILQPAYYDKFSCIGGACEDTCCTLDWAIYIDKKTYFRYKNHTGEDFQQKIAACVKRNRGTAASENQYAYFTSDTGTCPFHQEDGLCQVHAELGAGALCLTCRIYPRLSNTMLKNLVELSLTMSCPEVVRVALLDKNPITFQMGEKEFAQGSAELRSVNSIRTPKGEGTDYTQHAMPMREGCIDILQLRRYTVAQRIAIVGMLLKKTDELAAQGQHAQIPATVQLYVQAAGEGQFADLLQDMDSSDVIATQMSGVLLAVMLSKAGTGQKAYRSFIEFKQAFEAHIKELGLEEGQYQVPQLAHGFIKDRVGRHWSAFLEQYEHVLENYLVNFVFSSMFPFKYYADGMSPYHHFIVLAEQYAILRMLLCGTAGEDGITEAQLVRAITSVSNVNQHSNIPKEVMTYYGNARVDSLAHIAFLLAGYAEAPCPAV